MQPVHFKFDLDKFIASLAMFAKEQMKNLDVLKTCKLLYYADKYHTIKYGRPIIGDTYVHMDNGPVPSKAYDIIKEVINNDVVDFLGKGKSNKDKFKEYLKVKKPLLSKYPVFELIKDPDLDCLSGSEQEAINETIKKYGNFSPVDLLKSTHKDASWQKTKNSEDIDYRLFFENEPEAKTEALEYMESLYEDKQTIYGLEHSD